MLRHSDVWRAIDTLAARYKLSPSGLARKAGLDATTFNKSKRVSGAGRLRWPSTESVSKILKATGASLEEFYGLLAGEAGLKAIRRVPLIGQAKAGQSGFFDDAGFPAGAGWDEFGFPDLGDPNAYALEIDGDSMAPVYRAGDVVVVSPHAAIRRNDRVVVKTVEGEVMCKVLVRQSAKKLELGSLNPSHAGRELAMEKVQWIHRIVWASQ